MKLIWGQLRTAMIMGAVIPCLILSFAVMLLEEEEAPMQSTDPAATETVSMGLETVSEKEKTVMYLRDAEGNTEQMDMDDYLTGVVLAEMPASFENEALKAQAVAARTYTRKAVATGGKHGDSSVCTDPACCQAYISQRDYLDQGGSPENLEKVRSAVLETSGYVLMYEGTLIEATYFSCSGGMTEDAAAVWGTDFPYLRSVESPGEENAAHYSDSVTYTAEAFADALGVTLSGTAENWFTAVTYTSGGGVDTMTIGGKSYKGTELRSLLGLRSTAFTVAANADTVIITTRGFGHRVGMSQYGADAMAVTGSTFQEILAHYYPGTELVLVEN